MNLAVKEFAIVSYSSAIPITTLLNVYDFCLKIRLAAKFFSVCRLRCLNLSPVADDSA